MSSELSPQNHSNLKPLTRFEQLRLAQSVLRAEAGTLDTIASRLGPDFCDAIERIYSCPGFVVVTGMGKAGHIARKISATLASTGTRSLFLHPAEAIHGDLGRTAAGDVALVLSQSGETEEITRLLPTLDRLGLSIIAITATSRSTLGRAASIVLELGELREACTLGLAPSTSTAAMLALGDAIAIVTSALRGFERADFARFHPGGSLGRKLRTVDDLMRPAAVCRFAHVEQTVREVFAASGMPERRSGAIMVLGEDDRLAGLFTDSDLARLFEARRYDAFDDAISAVMTCAPKTIMAGTGIAEAVSMLAEWKLSELPVVDATGRVLGLLDITDVVGVPPDKLNAGFRALAG